MKLIQEYMLLSKDDRKKHIDLNESCIERGGDSIQFRGLLAHYVDTTIPAGKKVMCCHACNNGNCCNPKHLYWGTSAENISDFWESLTPEEQAAVTLRRKERVTGEKNHYFEIAPWKNNNGKPECWKKAQLVYEDLSQNYDLSERLPWGKGRQYVMTKYAMAQGPARTMITKFKKGWVPNLDSEWLELFTDD